MEVNCDDWKEEMMLAHFDDQSRTVTYLVVWSMKM